MRFDLSNEHDAKITPSCGTVRGQKPRRWRKSFWCIL